MVPFDNKSPFVTSGIRLGTPAITTRGLVEKDIDFIVEYIDQAICLYNQKKSLKSLSIKVNQTMGAFPIFKYS